MAYIGPEPRLGQNREVDDISSGFNGNTATFNLTVNGLAVSPGSANAILVSLGGVIQNPGTDYTVSTSTITFTTNPASGLSFFALVLGQGIDTLTIADGQSPTMLAPVITGDLSIADKIVHTGDTNNAIRFPAADTIAVETAGAERLRVDSLGNLLLGHSSARGVAGTVNRTIQIEATDASASLSIARNEANSAGPFLSFGKTRSSSVGGTTIVNDGDTLGTISFAGADGTDLESRGADIIAQVDGTPGVNDMPGRLVFKTSADGSVSTVERMRINSSGNVGIGTSTMDHQFSVVAANSATPRMGLHNPDAAENFNISSYHDSNGIYVGIGANAKYDANGNMAVDTTTHKTVLLELDARNNGAFVVYTGSTGGVPSERMRVAQGGAVTFNATGDVGGGKTGTRIQDPEIGTCRFAVSTTASDTHIQFLNNNANSVVGSITTVSSSTAYNTSSDYRLKENVSAISDGITRLKTLKPSRFNFKADTDKTLDGFLAHEVTAVPEAITGEKDAVAVQADVDKGVSDKVGDPIYQQIDQSKLIPLLTAALQESITKIETLETKVAALEAA